MTKLLRNNNKQLNLQEKIKLWECEKCFWLDIYPNCPREYERYIPEKTCTMKAEY